MAQPARDQTTVVKGILFPSNEDIKKIVSSLRRKVKTDPKIASQFKKDPRRTLGALGLNEDVQVELLRDMGVKAPALRAWCICTDCCKTCWCSACCVTDVGISITCLGC